MALPVPAGVGLLGLWHTVADPFLQMHLPTCHVLHEPLGCRCLLCLTLTIVRDALCQRLMRRRSPWCPLMTFGLAP